ncbi:AT-rich interactive domain-containing protein 5 [Hibiscus syriacus]|uniref:AT-rich interactive domain-containing protein 5 n=1 Tax=Hibiscus syriacus TaxID=106335 RepID=A0A6A3CVW8_HIBSY|nr:AT-rich interactive domain-containing protein 5 [Hibiscus syriacus]
MPTDDQNANETIADETLTLTLTTDVDMTDNPPLPDKPDSKSSADAPADAPLAEPLEKESNGDAAPLPSTPKSEPERVEKPKSWLLDPETGEADEAGTLEERAAFMKELESFSSKLWRQVGESFNPPKTCTTVSWTFRIFYEKALLEYEKYKRENGEIQLPASPLPHASGEKESSGFLPGSGRARRDAAARAMQGWHAQRSIGYGEDKISSPTPKRERHLKNIGLQKQKTPINMESGPESDKQLVTEVVDAGTPADWVKINVRETKDCFEVYALVPGLLREEVVTLPARIDPLQTSAVVSLHGRLFVRVPFEQGSM